MKNPLLEVRSMIVTHQFVLDAVAAILKEQASASAMKTPTPTMIHQMRSGDFEIDFEPRTESR
ncbi:MAG: hypothetical protein WA001_05590 [Patescibacteria group bacterium]